MRSRRRHRGRRTDGLLTEHPDTAHSPNSTPTRHRPAPRPIDFGAHVLLTTQDYAISGLGLAAKALLAPFNHHRLHHLLPAVDASRLPELEPVLQQTCAEFGHPYRLYSFRELASSTLRNWLDLPSPPLDSGEGGGGGGGAATDAATATATAASPGAKKKQ